MRTRLQTSFREEVLKVKYEQILPLILALLLIFILPMLMRRYGLRWEDLLGMLTSRFGKKDYESEARRMREKQKDRQEPYLTNSRSADLKSLVSSLLMLARRYKLGLVYPGTISYKGQLAGLLALVVTKNEVIGLNCFGYGGTITEDKSSGRWNQHMNGADQAFDSPLTGNEKQKKLVRASMDANGMKDVPLKVVSVFTAHGVTLHTSHPGEVYTTEGLLLWLREIAVSDGPLDPEKVSRQLNEQVQRIRKK